jgi:hypothetical protein
MFLRNIRSSVAILPKLLWANDELPVPLSSSADNSDSTLSHNPPLHIDRTATSSHAPLIKPSRIVFPLLSFQNSIQHDGVENSQAVPLSPRANRSRTT